MKPASEGARQSREVSEAAAEAISREMADVYPGHDRWKERCQRAAEAALPALRSQIEAEVRERLATHCDEMGARNKAVWRLDADLSEYERTDAKATTLTYEAMARFIRGEDMLGQIRRENNAALATTSEKGGEDA